MELLAIKPNQSNGVVVLEDVITTAEPATSTSLPFIQANTETVTLSEMKEKHIIPTFFKDNETLISHFEFIEATQEVVSNFYSGESILLPSIKVSHPIKGRIPSAMNKPATQLEEWEKTLYYERMMFIIEIPTIQDSIGGNSLSLTIGGVKSFSLDNLYGKKGSDEHFKIFCGFKNSVCTNLCVWSDGLYKDIKVNSIGQLMACIRTLLENYNAVFHLEQMKRLNDFSLTESQFAHVIGRARLYQSLPPHLKKDITPLLFGDNQIGAVCKDYYKDESFCRDEDGNINLWKLYNLFTGVNKSSYIDNFLDKAVNAYHFAEQLRWALEDKSSSWFLN